MFLQLQSLQECEGLITCTFTLGRNGTEVFEKVFLAILISFTFTQVPNTAWHVFNIHFELAVRWLQR